MTPDPATEDDDASDPAPDDATDATDAIEVHLGEGSTYPPSEDFAAKAHVADPAVYEEARADREAFWAAFADELDWSEPWDEVLRWDPPHAEWFVGGKLNASVNCVDRHVEAGHGDRVAIHWQGEPGDRRTLTYRDLQEAVGRAANGFKELGVERGDRVTLYLPMVPELPVAMLALARIGAPHNVVFAGFSPTAVAERMADSQSRVLVTCDGYPRRGETIPHKARADEAVEALLADDPDAVDHVVVVERAGGSGGEVPLDDADVPWDGSRDVTWDDVVAGQPADCPPEAMDAEDVLFLMYTSGTTGRPKGVVHTTGGYLTGTYATTRWVFDLKPADDVYWCMADIGWITGHSYIVYGPLANGATTVMYEGAPDHPDPGRPWDLVEEYGVTILYTAPTAVRAFMRHGRKHPDARDLSSLRLLGSVGEPINPAAWEWYRDVIGGGTCPVVDTWWQTETGMILVTPLPGVSTLKPGSAGRPFPGIEAAVLDDAGDPVPPGKGGNLAVLEPWPAMLRTLWQDDERFRETYWSKWDGRTYYPADGARVDADGDLWIVGRLDDVLNVAGHRLGTMELESALVEHPAVAEAAVVGAPDEVKGTRPVGFVLLEAGREPSDELRDELVAQVEKAIGPIARPRDVYFCLDLPKTRSGKIMRRLLEDLVAGRELGDTTTLRNPEVAKELQAMVAKAQG